MEHRIRSGRGGGSVSLPRRVARWVSGVLAFVLVVVVVVAAYFWLVQGTRYLPILTGSMAPGMPAGSLAVTNPIGRSQLQEGQVIAFSPPKPYAPSDGKPVVHRIVHIEPPKDGDPSWMQTKGDANSSEDPWKVSLAPDSPGDFGHVVAVIPLIGTPAQVLHALGPINMLLLLAGLLLLGFGMSQILSIRKDKKKEQGRPNAPPSPEVSLSGDSPAEVLGAHEGTVTPQHSQRAEQYDPEGMRAPMRLRHNDRGKDPQ